MTEPRTPREERLRTVYEAGKAAGERWLADPESQKYDHIPTNKWESWFEYADTIHDRTLERGYYSDLVNSAEDTKDELKQEYDRGFDEVVAKFEIANPTKYDPMFSLEGGDDD